jgi:hypothetical protein
LNEVVVTALGIKREKNPGYSVGKVDGLIFPGTQENIEWVAVNFQV